MVRDFPNGEYPIWKNLATPSREESQRILALRQLGQSSRNGVAAFLARVLPAENAATFCSASSSLGSASPAKRVVIFSP
jgi:hypothetical protein